MVRELPEGVADDVHGRGAGFRLLGLEELGDELGVRLVLRPSGPEGFAEVVLVGRVLLVELGGPGLHGGEHFARGVAAEFATGAVAGAVFGLLEVLEEFGDGSAGDLRGLHQRTLRVGDAVDAAMLAVAVGIACVVLHVADERIMPVDEVERAVRGELEVHRAEVAVGRGEEVAVGLAGEAGAVVGLLAEADAEEADGVADHEVALLRFREVTRRDEFGARRRTGALRDELFDLDLLDAVGDFGRERHGPPVLARGGVGQEGLFPIVEGEAPRIGDVGLHAFEAVGLRVEAPGAAVVAAARAIRGLDLAVEEAAFEEVEGARGVGAIGRDGVVRVVGIEAVQDQFRAVRLAVLVVVDEQGEVRLLRDVDAFGSDFEADRDVELVREHRLLVGFAVAVGVLEDQELVVRQRITRAVVRVGRGRGDPEAALAVERHLHRLLEVREFLFGCEEGDLIAGQELHLLDGGFAGKELRGITVLLAGLEVGRHGGQDEGPGVIDGEVGLLALGDVVDERVADHGHLAALVDLVGIVLRAEGVVTLAVGVNAVEDRVIGVPHVVLQLHRAVHEGFVGLGGAGLGAVESVGEELGDLAVTEVRRGEAVDGIGRLRLTVRGEGGVEEVDVSEAVLLGDALHGGGVELEVGVFLGAVRQVAGLGEVFEGDRRDEHQARGGLAIVGLGQGVDDEGVDFGFVVGGAAGAVERFVVTEERDDGVGLQVEEPLVRGREEALAVVLRILGMELVGARESPLAGTRRVRAEGRGVAGATHVADEELLLREAEVQFGLEAAVVGVALGETVADEDHAFAGGGRGDLLAAGNRRVRRVLRRSVRRRRALAVIRPVGGVRLILLGFEFAAIDDDRLVGGDQAGGEEGEKEAGTGLHERGGLAYLYARFRIIQPELSSGRLRFPS